MLRELFHKLLSAPELGQTDATADSLRRLMPSCGVCGCGLNDHNYVQIGCAFQKANMLEIFKVIEARDWSRLARIDEFDPMRNALTVYAVKGPHEAGLVLAVLNPFELYAADELCKAEILN